MAFSLGHCHRFLATGVVDGEIGLPGLARKYFCTVAHLDQVQGVQSQTNPG